MTGEQIGGIVRTLLAALGGAAVARGWGDAETWAAISGAVVTIAVAGWSVWQKTRAAK